MPFHERMDPLMGNARDLAGRRFRRQDLGHVTVWSVRPVRSVRSAERVRPATAKWLPANRLRTSAAIVCALLMTACGRSTDELSARGDPASGVPSPPATSTRGSAIHDRSAIAGPRSGVDLGARLRHHVDVLSADRLQGRMPGTEGIALAESYVAARFAEIGLEPFADPQTEAPAYRLPVSLYRNDYGSSTALTVRLPDREVDATLGADFRPLPGTSSGAASGPLIFAGYGITAPEHDWDDYAGIDASGAIVLVLRHEPNETDPDSSFAGTDLTRYALFQTKIRTARRHGAAGLLLFTDPNNPGPPDDMRTASFLRLEPAAGNGSASAGGIPAAHITMALAEAIVADAGYDIAQLQHAIDDGSTPSSLQLGEIEASLRIEPLPETEHVVAHNIAALLPGSDPERADEIVVVGAHHDHLGWYEGPGDTIYNGADDNASGVSVLIEVAQRLAAGRTHPARSILFVTFSAEEHGLLGSRAALRSGQIPADRTVFMLNLDMLGRNGEDPVEVYGARMLEDGDTIVSTFADQAGLAVHLNGEKMTGNSDHASFLAQGIPAIALFTGTHDDYHTTTDHAALLDYPRMQRIVDLAAAIVSHVANGDSPPKRLDVSGAR